MDPKWQAVFFLLAFLCFVVAALEPWFPPGKRPAMIATGLAFFTFVFLYTAFKAI